MSKKPRFFDAEAITLLVIGLVISSGLWWWTRSWVAVIPFVFLIGTAWGEPLEKRQR